MDDNTTDKKIMTFGVFNGCLSELNFLDFSRLNLRFINGYGNEAKNLFNETFENAEEIIKRLTKISILVGGYAHHMQLLIPIDFSKPVFEKDIMLVEEILKIIFPSDLTLNFVERFVIENGKAVFNSGIQYQFKQSGQANENYCKVNPQQYKKINKFIEVFFQNCGNIKYYKNVWSAYLSSFDQNSKTMEYISLSIALESIIEGKSELNYRIKRNTSILIGPDKKTSNLIFKNVGKLYDLRSNIVHSSEYNEKTLEKYLPYLRDLVSILLRELIIQNICDLCSLNNILTESGFGDKKNLTKNYFELELYDKSYMTVVNTLLEK